MSEWNRLDGILAIPHEGGELRLARQYTNAMKAEYEDWLEAQARRRIFRLRSQGLLDEAEYRASLGAVISRSAAGAFAWGSGDIWAESLASAAGIAKIVSQLAAEADRRLRNDPSHRQQVLTVEAACNLLTSPSLTYTTEGGEQRNTLVDAVKEVITATPNFISRPEVVGS